MGRAIGGVIQGIGNIKEAKAKRRDGKQFIEQAKQKQRNFERTDSSINHIAQTKISGAAEKLATDNIQIANAELAANAAAAGIRGIGMINQIQQNTNQALAEQSAKLAEKQDSVNFAAAKEQARMTDRQIELDNREQDRIDSMLERGQALRSQGAAEAGRAATNIGGALDNAVGTAGKFFAEGGFKSFGKAASSAFGGSNNSGTPSAATNPYFGG